jgi:hypothetical protein
MVVLITPTGNRPIQFGLCEYFMKRQTYQGDVIWIIIDDGIPVITDNVKYDFKENWTIIKTYPKPAWSFGQNTQFRNIIAGVRTLLTNYSTKDIRAVFMIEDDDYYKPIYIEKMMTHLKQFDIIGEKNSIYYNVHFRKYFVWGNVLHASLFQTVISPSAISYLVKACDRPLDSASWYIDMQIWGEIKNKKLFNDGNLAIGIKGMTGRFGIGSMHDDRLPMTPDPQMGRLQMLIGEDYKLYEQFYDQTYGKRRVIAAPPYSYRRQLRKRRLRR